MAALDVSIITELVEGSRSVFLKKILIVLVSRGCSMKNAKEIALLLMPDVTMTNFKKMLETMNSKGNLSVQMNINQIDEITTDVLDTMVTSGLDIVNPTIVKKTFHL